MTGTVRQPLWRRSGLWLKYALRLPLLIAFLRRDRRDRISPLGGGAEPRLLPGRLTHPIALVVAQRHLDVEAALNAEALGGDLVGDVARLPQGLVPVGSPQHATRLLGLEQPAHAVPVRVEGDDASLKRAAGAPRQRVDLGRHVVREGVAVVLRRPTKV